MMTHPFSLSSRVLACLAAAMFCALPVYAAPAKKSSAKKPSASARKKAAPPKKAAPKKSTPSEPKKAAPAAAAKPTTGVAAHEQFPAFLQSLEKMVKENSTDYFDAVSCVLTATDGDELALNDWMNAAAAQGNVAAERWVVSQKLADLKPAELLSAPIKENYQKLVKMADKGYVPAMLDVSACLRMGIGTAVDEAAAQRMLMEACKGGDMKARFQWLLSTKRLAAWEDKDKPEVAAEIDRGNFYVINHLSALAPDAATQVEWMKTAAGKGSGDAYLTLSKLASVNHPKESLTLLNLAVYLHHPEAIFLLGMSLADNGATAGFQQVAGITPDAAKSLRLIKTAALLGSLPAAMSLGRAYYDGSNGLQQDYKKAYFHFSNPQIAGNPASVVACALLELQGTTQNAKAAVATLENLSQQFPPAAIALAWAQFKGVGVKADAKAASNLLKEAAATGSPIAYVYLAYIYARGGEGVAADESQAKRYVRLASLDMGDEAQKIYDHLIVEGWIPHP